MPIFNNNEGKLVKLNAYLVDKERKLQKLVEDNLQEVLDLVFLETEYVTTFGGRIDTLAVDMNGTPVIIEYKKNTNDNIINQALSYLKWLKAQKVEFFERLIQKKENDFLQKIKIDWKNPRVICIAENYSKFDRDTVEVIPIKIELYKYRFYENDIFSLELVDGQEQKIKSLVKEESIQKNIPAIFNTDSSEISEHLKNINPEIKECFNEMRSRILSMDETITELSRPKYIAYKLTKNFAEVHVGKSNIKIHLRPASYIDPAGLIEQVPETYKWSLDRRLSFKSIDEIDMIMSFIKQSYNSVL